MAQGKGGRTSKIDENKKQASTIYTHLYYYHAYKYIPKYFANSRIWYEKQSCCKVANVMWSRSETNPTKAASSWDRSRTIIIALLCAFINTELALFPFPIPPIFAQPSIPDSLTLPLYCGNFLCFVYVITNVSYSYKIYPWKTPYTVFAQSTSNYNPI